MAEVFAGTYTSTILLTNGVQQNPSTLTGVITVHGTNPSSGSGFYSNAAVDWSITNLGSIAAYGAISYGIALLDGGIIQNGNTTGANGAASGIIRSDETGILITGAAGRVTNDGSIIASMGRGVFLQDGGTLTNGSPTATGATILGGFVGVAIYNANGALSNAGSIGNTGTAGLGVELYAGTLTNQVTGRISGNYGVGFVGHMATGTLTNAGSITGSTRDGVALSAGGVVTNSGSIYGAIAGVIGLLYGTPGLTDTTISNTGTITGAYAGIDLLAGGSVSNAAGARITGGFGVSFGNGTLATALGTLSNSGVISGTRTEGVSLAAGGGVNNAGSIYGAAAGVAAFYGSAAIINTGAISSGLAGVFLASGGMLTNMVGGSIAGSYGAVIGGTPSGQPGPPSALSNAGVIAGTGSFGVELLTNGVFVNQAGGTISGGRYGVYIRSVTGTIENYGVITGQVGIYSRAVVANGNRYAAQVTIINAGTLSGSAGQSVSVFSSNDLLIDKPGAVFIGGVVAGGARLELAAGSAGAIGTVGTINAALANFSTVTVDSGANWIIGGTIAAGEILYDLGTLRVQSGAVLTDNGTITGSAGTPGTTGTITLATNGVLICAGTFTADTRVVFADAHGHLQLTNPAGDLATHVGFAPGSTIYLPNIAAANLAESYAGTTNGGTLTLSQSGTPVAHLLFSGSYTTASFQISADLAGGADVTIPCFVAGTRIATQAGEQRVERLRVGMRVLTASGTLRPIIWIGQRRVELAEYAEPARVRPVRIARGAFGPDQPLRDLMLSPDHAVWHGGALIPVQLLVNGGSVAWLDVPRAHYLHVELDRHDILLAEGLPVESYRCTGNRAALGLADAEPPSRDDQPSCAPLALGGSAVARARRHLLVQTRAAAGRPAPPVGLRAGGRLHRPIRRGNRLLFLLPPGAEAVSLEPPAPPGLRLALLDGVPVNADGMMKLAIPPSGAPRCLELLLG